ncbi:peptidase domain-containing ABC transporter [Flavobacterium psychrophilum]|uniref:Probable ABC-type multidrug transport system, ATPase and permease components n=2 Tax=Flavobacterium psychrophilum TaxID=96345 RepID=A6H0R9_FLAPJ|nr:peptidase domain-containing ABC transporter [Flavobacterium psychrophilum]AIG30627.1 ABC transporter ATP-binding protein [Flavobacterium psychrophilum]AIG32902.1 ABC transporter ATP-binding protein [Flavobacterium psychrophilum]AIG35057.1 ABC transporter ATP-binding protein [Flavobacterium psychrophilum]AIG37422.1 ABC transporter ATP-binding protein [Flavobacterium psychrophilum]AIG39686.1 ABC transporter ATP-binding protein [Flavobacterium psychrophilum]
MIFKHQKDQMDCGPACLAMVSSFYKKNYSLQYLRENSFITREGVSLLGITEASKKIGYETISAKLTIEKLIEEKQTLPCILHWNQNHFVVLKKISKKIFTNKYYFHIADPGHGTIKLNQIDFKKSWLSDIDKGVALFLNPTEIFYKLTPPKEEKLTIKYILSYLTPYKKQLLLLFSMLLIGSCLTLIFPFLTQNLIDKGVNKKDLSFIGIILLAQLGVFLGSIIIEIIRNWIMLYIGTKISISIISDFLKKLLQLPIKFFDTKMMGDFNQRIQDNERIEHFLTSQSLLTFFSIITFSVFFGVLWYYNFTILIIYLSLTILSITWSFFWLKKRKILDYFLFQQRSQNQESIYEIINGVTEMKLNQFEDFKRKEWETIQQKLFKINIRVLKIDQFQLSGFEFLNQVKNILVTFLAATFVVKNTMTLGELLSVSYIIGQMNSPVNQLVNFFRSLQDAKLSLERLNEVQNHPTEEQNSNKKTILIFDNHNQKSEIKFNNVSFQYEGPESPYVLKDINFKIPEGKVTAIVGASGSGKTTLMKLLLKFYEPTQGELLFNSENINNLSPKSLRENCGVVMQDGFIFSDTIERNIATGDENINKEKLQNAVKIANIEEFVKSLPLGYNTKIGASGNGISGGQKQRILIARAVYKNPHYIFFDEATSALDAENEKIIHDNLQQFFKGKTVLIIAHRLSTVKNADQIIVLKNGEIAETGNHQQLVQNKGDYFNLVKNQLELGD